jgi:hypothetical protein
MTTSDPAAHSHQHATCPGAKGCQPSLLHGRWCVQHCPCRACAQIRLIVIERQSRRVAATREVRP